MLHESHRRSGRALRRSPLFGPFAAAAFGALLAQLPASIGCAANVVVYSNLDNFSAKGDTNGATAPSDPADNTVSSMLADDLTPISGFTGDPVTSIDFTVYNANKTAPTFFVGLRFYSDDGPSGGPGTLLASQDFLSSAVPANNVQIFGYSPGTPIFNLPAGVLWVGEFFRNGSPTTATSDEVGNFGEGIFNPPTIGSSSDNIFEVDDTSMFMFNSNDPSGDLTNFGGDPVANFGFAITVTATPEPNALGLTSMAMLGLLKRPRK